MIIRKSISLFARLLYSKEYNSFCIKLKATYSKVDIKTIRTGTLLLEQLLISGEDHRYKYHVGFDFIAIIRSIKNNFFYGKNEGGSTIEQQLVRVITNDYKKNWRRKIKEIFLATTLCDIIPKDEIPILYLQVAYYGPNIIGLKMIINKLKITQYCEISENAAAEIIARLKYPESIGDSEKRFIQIERRKNHLLYLYKKHKNYKFLNPYLKSSIF